MQELQLLEQVELRLALADTATKFQGCLDTFLCPVLLKVSSPNETTRQKVLDVNFWIKSDEEIQLPNVALCNLLHTGSHVVKSFALIYLDIGIPRNSDLDQVALIPLLLKDLSKQHASHLQTFFHILIPLIAKYPNNSEMGELAQLENDVKFFTKKIQPFFLYHAPPSGRVKTALDPKTVESDPLQYPNGMSKNQILFFTNNLKAVWTRNANMIAELKIGIMKFTMMQHFNADVEKFVIYLIASCDTWSNVQSVGDEGMKRFAKPDFESPVFIKTLYDLYQGGGIGDDQRPPAISSIKVRVLELLAKSILAANTSPFMIQVIFDALYGDGTNSKIRQAGISFTIWVFRMANPNKLEPVAKVFLAGLLKLINEKTENETREQSSLRGFAYEAIGLLSKKAPSCFDVDILFQFFDAFSTESRDIRVAIQDGLTSMISAYKSLKDSDKESVLKVLLQNVKREHQARYVALKYANNLYHFSNPVARYICLALSCDPKLEVREEARSGLALPPLEDPEWQARELPGILELESIILKYGASKSLEQSLPGTSWVGNIPADVYTNILTFFRTLIIIQANPDAQIPSFESLIESKPKLLNETRVKLVPFIQKMWDTEPKVLETYIKWIENALESSSDGPLISIASGYLVELFSIAPTRLVYKYYEKIDWLKSFLSSGRLDTKDAMAHILGLVGTMDLEKPERQEKFSGLVNQLLLDAQDMQNSKNNDKRNGASLGLGYLIGKLMYRMPFSYQDHLPIISIERAVVIIASLLDTGNIVEGCMGLSEIGRYSSLPSGKLADSEHTVENICEKLFTIVKTRKEPKIQEAAILAIGHLTLGNPLIASKTLESFKNLPMSISKNIELSFNCGEALAAIMFGFQATHMVEYLDIIDVELAVITSSSNFEFFETILDLCKPTSSTASRKQASVWLLCLTRFCGHCQQMKDNMLKIQQCFSSLLSDRDEFVQEIASKGIGLLYEMGNEQVRKALVEELVSSLTIGKKLNTVTGDTQLFQESIGSSPDGGNITTYQSILSLAADMNQPDLVYKFMSLASHSALWNSRRGASMGFHSIAKQAEEELAVHLPKIVPKLYRYQFDPNPKVSQSMKNIWKTLVKDPSKTVASQYDEIVAEILKSMGDRQWRLREAGCGALMDILVGRNFEDLQRYMNEFWNMCFRCLDDIKESVRKAAFLTCKSLTNITVRYCDPMYISVSKGQNMMDIIVPFLLQKGLSSTAEEVRSFALSTILRLCKTGGVLLKPHCTDLVGTLLESLSALEPQLMNYLTFHASSYNVTQEQIDTSRLQAAKSSPVLDSIERLVSQIDDQILTALIPRLTLIIKKGVGLPTRAGTARYIYFLVSRLGNDLKPYCDSLMKALSGAIFDRSAIVRKTFSTALGHVCKIAPPEQIEKVVNYLQSKFLEATESEQKSVCAITWLEMCRNAPDAMRDFHSVILPCAFMGSRDTSDPQLSKIWADLWEENTAGSQAALRKWTKEILDQCADILKTTSSWQMKQQIGKSLVDIAKAQTETSYMDRVLPLLLESLNGRTWPGKECLLEALAQVSIHGKEYFSDKAESKQHVENVMIREAKKNNLAYKRQALVYLGNVFEALESTQYFQVKDYLIEMTQLDGDSEMDVDDDIKKPTVLAIQANAFKALGQCFHQNNDANELFLYLGQHVSMHIWNIRLNILEAICCITKKANNISLKSLEVLLQGVIASCQDYKYAIIRENSVDCLVTLLKLIKTHGKSEYVKSELNQLLDKEPTDAVKMKIQNLLKTL